MINSKIEHKIFEIEQIINDSRFIGLIKEKLEYINSEFDDTVAITLINSESAAKISGTYKKAKIEWNKLNSSFPRVPLSIKIDILNLKNLDFLFAFLHECGHLKDYDNLNIQLKSKKSEVSAWKHALDDIRPYFVDDKINKAFYDTVRRSLNTYGIVFQNMEDLEKIDIMTINE